MNIGKKLDTFNIYLAPLLAFTIPVSAAANNVIFYVMFLLYLLSGNWKHKWNCIRSSQPALAALLLLALTYLSITYSLASDHYALSMAGKYNKLLLIPILLYLFRSETDLKHCLYALWAALLLTLFLGYLYKHLPASLQAHYFMVNTPFIMHIETNMMMAFFAFWLIYHALKKDISLKTRIPYALLALFTTYYVFALSPGRSGWVIFIALMIYLIVLLIHQRQWKKSVLIMLIGLLGFGIISQSHEFKTRLTEGKNNLEQYFSHQNTATSWGDRLTFYKTTLMIVEEHWLIGTGIGGFQPAYQALVNQYHIVDNTVNPHNQYLDTTSQLGIPGIILLLWLFLSAWYTRNKSNEMQSILAQATVITLMVGCLFNSWLMDIHAGFFFCLFAALSTWKEKA